MKKFNKLALAVLATAALSSSVFAGTVKLKQNAEDANTGGSEFRLGVVAKVLGTIEVDLVNSGFTEKLVETDGIELQAFAFGQKDAGATALIEAEKYSIDSNVPQAELRDEACVSAAPESIQRLTEYSPLNPVVAPAVAGPGSCALSNAGTLDTISAMFRADYKIKATGGLHGTLIVDSEENGIGADYITLDPAVAFDQAEVSDISNGLTLGADVTIGNGDMLEHSDKGVLEYKLAFDISGAQGESRAVFSHLLSVE